MVAGDAEVLGIVAIAGLLVAGACAGCPSWALAVVEVGSDAHAGEHLHGILYRCHGEFADAYGHYECLASGVELLSGAGGVVVYGLCLAVVHTGSSFGLVDDLAELHGGVVVGTSHDVGLVVGLGGEHPSHLAALKVVTLIGRVAEIEACVLLLGYGTDVGHEVVGVVLVLGRETNLVDVVAKGLQREMY